MSHAGESWKVVVPCTRAVAETLTVDLEEVAGFPEPPVLLAREPDPHAPDHWLIEAYFDEPPNDAVIKAVQALVPDASVADVTVVHVPAEDWLTVSQAGFEPVRAGRFYVHTSADSSPGPSGSIPFLIDAGLAFGTGQHETTAGCLEMLDGLHRRGSRFRNVADIGTGTGLLAFAAHRLWPSAAVIASDIDPTAIVVAEENACRNSVMLGRRAHAVELVVARGLAHRRLRARAPFDLIIANILARPLIDLAPMLAGALAPGGQLILAGLLDQQADAVTDAYRKQRMRPADRITRGNWPTLRLVRRRVAC